MSWTEGYNPKLERTNVRDDECRTAIAAMCDDFAATLQEYGKSSTGDPTSYVEKLDVNQQIVALKDRKLNIKVVFLLKERWIQERQRAKRMLALLNRCQPRRDGSSEADAKRRQQQPYVDFCAVRTFTQSKSREFIRRNGLLDQHPQQSTLSEALDDFFLVCQRPTGAEITFLSRMCRQPSWVILLWFENKRKEMRPLYVAKAAVPCSGPAARYLRRKEYARSLQD